MARCGDVRPDTSPWLVAGVMGEIVARLMSGHRALKKMTSEPLLPETFAVGTFLVEGIVLTVHGIDEALTVLREVAPCVGDIRGEFNVHLDQWRAFRDDASHVVDRTLRVPVARGAREDNDSALNASTWGWEEGTLVVGYDSATDSIVTGSTSLSLGAAIDLAKDIYGLVSTRVNEEHHKGNIPPPKAVVT